MGALGTTASSVGAHFEHAQDANNEGLSWTEAKIDGVLVCHVREWEMAKKKKKAKKPAEKIGGPFLSAAIFCDGIAEDIDGILSISRIVDSVNLVIGPPAPPDMPSKEHPVTINPTMLLSFRTGNSPGTHMLKLIVNQPNGKRGELLSQEVNLSEPSHGGLNLKARAKLTLFTSGVYWIDVYLDGKRFTRMPLNVNIQRVDTDASATVDKAGVMVR